MRLSVLALSTQFALASLALLPAAAQTPATETALLPMPAAVQMADAPGLRVQPGWTVGFAAPASPRLQAATLRLLKRMEDKTGVPLPRSLGDAKSGTLTLAVDGDGAAVQGLDEDESYTLEITAAGARLHAATTTGALHGMETLLQLTVPTDGGYRVQAATVHDTPRFRWRGLMIDCGRHFEPMEVLKRNLDAMAAVKLNVFHWHLTEDQGFRIESKLYPRLTALGSDGKFYTQEDARELVRYARDRGIRVVPEFEMPGHSAAWLVAYPELNSGTEPEGIRREFGISDIAIDPTREETYTFLSRFLAEMTTIFPDSYVHIGGDETPAPDWKRTPHIVAFMQAHALHDNEALQAYFNRRVLTILTGLHRRMVGWDEIANPDLPRDVVIQSWRGEASLVKSAQQGFQGVLSQPYYLDAMKPAGVHYLADPVPANTPLTPAQQQRILGGEVCMWAEHLDERTIDSRIWPRTAAIAERFWSPQQVRDVNGMYRRLELVSVELESLGLHHLSSEDAGLRSLAGSTNIAALRSFALAFEPVPFYERYLQQHTSQLTPLTSFVDAVVPDPPIKHTVALATEALLAGPQSPTGKAAAEQLTRYFAQVGSSVLPMQSILPGSPRLQPIATRAAQLARLSTLGTEAVTYLSSGKAAPAGWKAQAQAELEEAKKPSAMVRFVFFDALTDLVKAVQ